MRTLGEILDSADAGGIPDHQECYWAMLALNSLLGFDHRELLKAGVSAEAWSRVGSLKAEESFRRLKTALAVSPQHWVGPEHDPRRPEVQERKRLSRKIFEKATGEKL